MNILLVTPEPPTDNAGNETTSGRWREVFRHLGHDVDVRYDYDPDRDDPDVLVALHAYKSHDAIDAFVERHPDRPLVVALTGTDLYKYREDHPEVDTNIRRADALVTLQDTAFDELDESLHDKTRTIYQSVGLLEPVDDLADSATDHLDDERFEVVVAAHLRDVKNPLLTARATRKLQTGRIRVTHVGRALGDDWRDRAEEEDEANPHYRWLGEVPRAEALRLIADADLLASTSRLEGGPNVVSEALALGTPVVTTDIPGHVGLVGDDYPGLVAEDDEEALADALQRAAERGEFYQSLVQHREQLAPRFDPARERNAWRRLLGDVTD